MTSAAEHTLRMYMEIQCTLLDHMEARGFGPHAPYWMRNVVMDHAISKASDLNTAQAMLEQKAPSWALDAMALQLTPCALRVSNTKGAK